MPKLKQELEAQFARLIVDELTDPDLVESVLIAAQARKTELRIWAMKDSEVGTPIRVGDQILMHVAQRDQI